MPSACFAPLPPLRLPSLKLTLSTFLPILSPFMLSLSSHPSHAPLPRLLSHLTALRSLLPPRPAGTHRPRPSQAPPAFLLRLSNHAPQPTHPNPRECSRFWSPPLPPSPRGRGSGRGSSGRSATSHPRRLRPPQTPPKHTPPHLKSFLEKTLTARETPAQRPSNTPGAPAPSPGPSARPRPHAQGTCQPIPMAPMGRPTPPPAPPSTRSFPASEARSFAQKNPPKPSLASPSPLGTGWRETVPPFTPTLRRRSLVAVGGTMSVRPRPAAPSYPTPR